VAARAAGSPGSVDGEAARLQKALVALAAGHRDLQGQVAQLVGQCERMTREMEGLAELLSKAHATSSQNLMLRQAMEEGLQKVPPRTEFRPQMHMVVNQPTHVSQFDSAVVAQLALQGSHSAHKEQLLREIMFIDGVSWEAAHKKLYEMDAFNERFYWVQTMPYRIGITAAVFGAIGGTLLVFCSPVAESYGTGVAGEALPEGVESIHEMTINQVGTWTWSWMEPMIGTASFVILCAQFARSQAWKLNMRPYTEAMQRWRADRLAAHYPQYDKAAVRAWAKHLPMVDHRFFPTYRRHLGFRVL